AGPDAPVTAQVAIGELEDDSARLPENRTLRFSINGQPYGQVVLDQEAALDPTQVDRLLAALLEDSRIEFNSDDHVWRLSDRGSGAILLKMDDFQGRVGTETALYKKGDQPSSAVLNPVDPPIVRLPALPKPTRSDIRRFEQSSDQIVKAIQAQAEDSRYCPLLDEEDAQGSDRPLALHRLSDTKLLASIGCWYAAYNFGDGYWVVNDQPPYAPVLVTDSGTDHQGGVIISAQKGRGLGDCWSMEDWTWDGNQFVHTQSLSTGMCKLMAAGGTWVLPTLVSEVIKPTK
ncbi:MAG: DUF1176 domain-containing protein, partial [Gammaproteobacteria bacterium]|nr:DUF1176 domain-containing protein [Gammaproteobacteria bacterium]